MSTGAGHADPCLKPRFLVTAGNTRERIDDVRDWGNIFTGGTGLAIANALAAAGPVELLTSNLAHLESLTDFRTPNRIEGVSFGSHADLKRALAERTARTAYHAVFMTAAVADYTPAGAFRVVERKTLDDGRETWIVENAQAGKIKSDFDEVAFLGRRSEKLVDLFRTAWGFKGLLVKFKLEVGVPVDRLLRIAEASRTASGADYIVANTLDMVKGPSAGAYLLGEGFNEWVPREDLPARLLRCVTEQ